MKLYKPTEFSRCDVEMLEELVFSKRLFSIGETTQKIRFLLPRELTHVEDCFFLSLKSGQQTLNLVLQPSNESNFSKCLLKFGGKENIPKDFLTAVVAFCSSQVIHILETFLAVPLSLQEGISTTKEEEKKIGFEVINEHGTLELRGEIKIPISFIPKIIAKASSLPREERLDLMNFLFPGEVIIGHAFLRPTQWNKLMPGDLLFLKEPSACLSGEVFFYFNQGQKIPFFLDLNQLQELSQPLKKVALSGFIPSDSHLREEKIKTLAQEQELDSLDQIAQIEIAFSAGQWSLKMKEMLALAQHKKLSHSPTLSPFIKILTQGVSIGIGTLVELHGQYAVFITQLY